MEPADKQSFFKETQQLAEQYIQERLLLLKYQTAERTAGIVSALLLGLCLGSLFFLITLVGSSMAIYFLAQLTSNWYAGFSIVLGLYVLILLVVYLKRKALRTYFSDMIVGLFFSGTQDPNDGEPNK